MSQPRIKWGQVVRFCRRTPGFSIDSRGGDKIVKGPAKDAPTGRSAVYIGHTSSRNLRTEVLPCYIKALERAFGIKPEDLAK